MSECVWTVLLENKVITATPPLGRALLLFPEAARGYPRLSDHRRSRTRAGAMKAGAITSTYPIAPSGRLDRRPRPARRAGRAVRHVIINNPSEGDSWHREGGIESQSGKVDRVPTDSVSGDEGDERTREGGERAGREREVERTDTDRHRPTQTQTRTQTRNLDPVNIHDYCKVSSPIEVASGSNLFSPPRKMGSWSFEK